MLENKFSRLTVLPPASFNLCIPSGAASGPAVGMVAEPEEDTGVPAEEGITQDSYLDATEDGLMPHHMEMLQVQQETKVAVKPKVTHNLVKNNEWTNETQETDNPETREVTFKTVKRRNKNREIKEGTTTSLSFDEFFIGNTVQWKQPPKWSLTSLARLSEKFPLESKKSSTPPMA